jgi:AraC-like DNA-binding protein
MNLLTGGLRTIILIGMVQGFVVSCMLFASKKNKQTNRLLGTIILLLSMACFNLYASYVNWFGSNLLRFIGDLIPLVVVMPVGPLIYFYVQSMLDPDFRVTAKLRRHFYPVIIDFVPQLTAIIFVIGVLTRLIRNQPAPWGNFIDTYNVYADIPRWISVSGYIWVSLKYLAAIKSKYNGSLNGLSVNFKWASQLTRVFGIFQCVWLLYLIPYVIPRYTDKMLDTFDWYPLYIPLAVMIYWLGMKGYVFAQQVSLRKPAVNQSSLSPDLVNQIVFSLKKSMEEDRIFLNPGCSLTLLSSHTGFSQKAISAVLNQHLHKSFNEYVNEYRISTFKQKIQEPEIDQFTMAGIALDCGFNSQATFQRTFKQVTGMSPTEFRQSIQELH